MSSTLALQDPETTPAFCYLGFLSLSFDDILSRFIQTHNLLSGKSSLHIYHPSFFVLSLSATFVILQQITIHSFPPLPVPIAVL